MQNTMVRGRNGSDLQWCVDCEEMTALAASIGRGQQRTLLATTSRHGRALCGQHAEMSDSLDRDEVLSPYGDMDDGGDLLDLVWATVWHDDETVRQAVAEIEEIWLGGAA